MSRCRANFEPLAGVLRVFADASKYGDPYQWSATVRFLDIRTVELMGILRAPKPSEWRAVMKLFAGMGVEKIVFHRRKNKDPAVKKEIDVNEESFDSEIEYYDVSHEGPWA